MGGMLWFPQHQSALTEAFTFQTLRIAKQHSHTGKKNIMEPRVR